jgi:putative membrane protein
MVFRSVPKVGGVERIGAAEVHRRGRTRIIEAMNAHIPTLLRLLAAAVLSINLSWAADTGGKIGGRLAIPDEEFVMKAAQGGLLEVKLGELAKQKGQRDDVKKFGDRMAIDHAKANVELKEVIARRGAVLPEQLDALHAGAVDRLSKLEGEQFDKAYIQEMVKAHEKDISLFENALKQVIDPELKAYVTTTLPRLKSHLQHAKTLEAGPAK